MCWQFRTRPTSFEGGAHGSRRWAAAASVSIDGWGWCWEDKGGREGGVEAEQVELQRLTCSTSHVIMSTHDHIHTTS